MKFHAIDTKSMRQEKFGFDRCNIFCGKLVFAQLQ